VAYTILLIWLGSAGAPSAVKFGLDVFPDGRLKDLLQILHVAVVLFVDLKYCHTRLPLGLLSVMMFETQSCSVSRFYKSLHQLGQLLILVLELGRGCWWRTLFY